MTTMETETGETIGDAHKIAIVPFGPGILNAWHRGRLRHRQEGPGRWPGDSRWPASLLVPTTAKASRATVNALDAVAREWLELPHDRIGDRAIRLVSAARSLAELSTVRPMGSRVAWDTVGRIELFETFEAVGVNRMHAQWGGELVLDVHAMCRTDEDLEDLWRLMRRQGFEPTITAAELDRADCWRFEHLGPMAAIREGFTTGRLGWGRANLAAVTVGCVLAGTYSEAGSRGDTWMRLVQARALIAGMPVGFPDGVNGPHTRKGLATGWGVAEAVIGGLNARALLAMMDERGTGWSEIAAS